MPTTIWFQKRYMLSQSDKVRLWVEPLNFLVFYFIFFFMALANVQLSLLISSRSLLYSVGLWSLSEMTFSTCEPVVKWKNPYDIYPESGIVNVVVFILINETLRFLVVFLNTFWVPPYLESTLYIKVPAQLINRARDSLTHQRPDSSIIQIFRSIDVIQSADVHFDNKICIDTISLLQFSFMLNAEAQEMRF